MFIPTHDQENQICEIMDRIENTPLAPADPITRFWLCMEEEDRISALYALGRGDELYEDICKEYPTDDEIQSDSEDRKYLYQQWAAEAV